METQVKAKIELKEQELKQKKQEHKKTLLNTAKIMKQANIPIAQIQAATGLSKEEIEKL